MTGDISPPLSTAVAPCRHRRRGIVMVHMVDIAAAMPYAVELELRR